MHRHGMLLSSAAQNLRCWFFNKNATICESTFPAYIIVTITLPAFKNTIFSYSIKAYVFAALITQTFISASPGSPRRIAHEHKVILSTHESLSWFGHHDAVFGHSTVMTDIVVAVSPIATEVGLVYI